MPLQGDQLSRMTIRGFKSIKSCDISFGKINVLIGSNGAGTVSYTHLDVYKRQVLPSRQKGVVWQKSMFSVG